MATVTVRDFAIFEANTPPPTSIWLSSQPPKISPFWLVSAGMASVRIQRSPQGSVSVTGGAWTAWGSVMSENGFTCSEMALPANFRLFETIPPRIRGEPATEFRGQFLQRRRDVRRAARPRIVQGTAAERCIAGAEDHGTVDHVGIVDNALAQ